MDEFVEELLKEDLNSYQNIYITDLALSENFYKKIKESGYAYKFKIFDHHKTHLFAKNYENVVIDIEECGTTLFYNYLSKKYKFKKIVEDYIKHVKNLDLWLWVEKFDFMAKELGNIFDLYGRNTYIEEMYQKLKRGKKFKWNKFENKILKIEKDRTRQTEDDIEIIDISNLIYKEEYKSKIKVTNIEEKNKILLIQELEGLNEIGTKQ